MDSVHTKGSVKVLPTSLLLLHQITILSFPPTQLSEHVPVIKTLYHATKYLIYNVYFSAKVEAWLYSQGKILLQLTVKFIIRQKCENYPQHKLLDCSALPFGEAGFIFVLTNSFRNSYRFITFLDSCYCNFFFLWDQKYAFLRDLYSLVLSYRLLCCLWC